MRVNLKAFIFAIAVFSTTFLGFQSAAESPLDGVELGNLISGPELKTDDLAGKIVFFEYWGFY